MNFGNAIQALKEGKKVARKGWNGKGMFLFLVTGRKIPCNTFRNGDAIELAKEIGTHHGDDVAICSHIDMICADGSNVVGWLASQTDMLSDDWTIVG